MWSKHIDYIVWTLEIEVKFYIVGFVFWDWFHRKSRKVFLIPIALFVGAAWLSQRVNGWIVADIALYQNAMVFIFAAQYLLFMFIGVSFHYMHVKRLDADRGWLAAAVLFVLFCLLWYVGPSSASFFSAWSYGFAVLTFAFAYVNQRFFGANIVTTFFANISYPLYVVHGVAGYVVLRVLLDRGVGASTALVVVTAICLLTSWCLHKFIERPSQLFGKALAHQIMRKDPAAVLA